MSNVWPEQSRRAGPDSREAGQAEVSVRSRDLGKRPRGRHALSGPSKGSVAGGLSEAGSMCPRLWGAENRHPIGVALSMCPFCRWKNQPGRGVLSSAVTMHPPSPTPLPRGRISAPAMLVKLCGPRALYFTSLRFRFPLLLKQNHIPDLTGFV